MSYNEIEEFVLSVWDRLPNRRKQQLIKWKDDEEYDWLTRNLSDWVEITLELMGPEYCLYDISHIVDHIKSMEGLA